ncbi:hypothetical protein ACLOJK_038873 [Asimina triloba]
MSTVLAFGFVPGVGFALSDHLSFDPAIPHRFIHVPTSMTRQTYNHIDFSPIAITLAAGENWPTLSAAATTPCPSRKAISAIPAASPAPRCLRKASSAPVVATTTPRPSRKVTPITVIATLNTALPHRHLGLLARSSLFLLLLLPHHPSVPEMPPLLLLSPLQHQPLNLFRRPSSPLLPQPPGQRTKPLL